MPIEPDWSTIIGGVASTLAAISLLPQVFRTWKTRSASDLSSGWLVTSLSSMILWIAYGSLLGAWAVAIANTITLMLVLILLEMKVRFDRKARHDTASVNNLATRSGDV